MVESVNNLIYNTLISRRAVCLPGVGTLCITRCGASQSGNSIAAPRYTISLTSNIEAVSIVDIIAASASVSQAEADEIFQRWISKVTDDNRVVINGIGVFDNKHFAPDAELVSLLNSTQFADVKIRRKRGSLLRSVLFILLGAAIAFTVDYFYPYLNWASWLKDKDTASSEVLVQDTQIAEPLLIEDVTANEVAVVEEPVSEPIVEPEPEVVATCWMDNTDIRHRVIVGSYSTIENAERAISDIERRNPDIKCAVYPLGSMFAVAVYGSSEKAECEEFVVAHRKQFSQIWIHTPKRFR